MDQAIKYEEIRHQHVVVDLVARTDIITNGTMVPGDIVALSRLWWLVATVVTVVSTIIELVGDSIEFVELREEHVELLLGGEFVGLRGWSAGRGLRRQREDRGRGEHQVRPVL